MSYQFSEIGVRKHIGSFGGLVPTLDASDGINVGDVAIDSSISPAKIWRCIDNTVGAPVWQIKNGI